MPLEYRLTGVSMNRSISAKATISSNLRAISRAHAQDRAVQVDVLAARQLGVKAGADLEQRAHAAVHLGAALGRLGDARQDLQQRALARAVAADDAQHLALVQLERHVAQRPDRRHRSAAANARALAAAQHAERRDQRGVDRLTHVAVVRTFADAVPLAKIVGANGDVTH